MSSALVTSDFVLFEESINAARECGHDLIFALEHRREVKTDAFDVDAVPPEGRLRLGEFFAGFQQGLAGDAADSQARATQRRLFFDAGHARAKLRRPNRRHISAGPCSDNNKVEIHWPLRLMQYE